MKEKQYIDQSQDGSIQNGCDDFGLIHRNWIILTLSCM